MSGQLLLGKGNCITHVHITLMKCLWQLNYQNKRLIFTQFSVDFIPRSGDFGMPSLHGKANCLYHQETGVS